MITPAVMICIRAQTDLLLKARGSVDLTASSVRLLHVLSEHQDVAAERESGQDVLGLSPGWRVAWSGCPRSRTDPEANTPTERGQGRPEIRSRTDRPSLRATWRGGNAPVRG